jgi:hypothetical protein
LYARGGMGGRTKERSEIEYDYKSIDKKSNKSRDGKKMGCHDA